MPGFIYPRSLQEAKKRKKNEKKKKKKKQALFQVLLAQVLIQI